jgi:hypothetical protein
VNLFIAKRNVGFPPPQRDEFAPVPPRKARNLSEKRRAASFFDCARFSSKPIQFVAT